MRHFFVICFTNLLFLGCVSVKIPTRKVMPAKGVDLVAPPAPFAELKIEKSDRAWLSEKTGNTISYLSECGGIELSLEQLESESLSAMGDLEIIKREELTYNGRAAIQNFSRGKIDGVPVQLSLVVFQKNGCNFILSYGGLAQNFETEKQFFENFKSDFKAP